MKETEVLKLNAEVPEDFANLRLDQTLAQLFPEYSRTRLKSWIEEGKVKIDDQIIKKPREKIQGGEKISIETTLEIQTEWQPENLPINIVYGDQDILVINKPANLVVHPGTNNETGTLVNALLYHYPDLKQIPRAGIVHRLDKDTTGLMVIAKTLESHSNLGEQLQERTVKRVYHALVWGNLISGGTISTQMGRHPKDPSKMAVVESGKEAITHFRILERFTNHTLIEINLETGRTHQIRVHMAYLQHPVVGDQTYGGRTRIPPKASKELLEGLAKFKRQALHAKKLTFMHPTQKKEMSFEVDLPEDFRELLDIIRNNK